MTVVLGTFTGVAQDNGIDADRPDFTESAALVPLPYWQLEFGYTYEKNGKAIQHTIGELLVRKPLSERVEFRLTVPSYRVFKIPVFEETGFEDLELGIKLRLKPDRFALILSTTIPTGSDQFRSRKLQPSAKLAFGQELGSKIAFGVNIGYTRLFIAATTIDEFSASASLQLELARRLGAYIEYYGFYYNMEAFSAAHYINGGLVFQITSNLLADARIGSILEKGIKHYFFGVGGVLRIR
jgi:hypothetical protein